VLLLISFFEKEDVHLLQCRSVGETKRSPKRELFEKDRRPVLQLFFWLMPCNFS